MVKRDGPTHPPKFWKVYRYVIEWYGLWTRGCTMKELCWIVSIDLLKQCLALSLSIYISFGACHNIITNYTFHLKHFTVKAEGETHLHDITFYMYSNLASFFGHGLQMKNMVISFHNKHNSIPHLVSEDWVLMKCQCWILKWNTNCSSRAELCPSLMIQNPIKKFLVIGLDR